MASDEDKEIVLVTNDNCVFEARTIIYNNDEITIENAILFNQKLQANLQLMKNELEDLLRTCTDKYNENEKLLEELTAQSSSRKIHTMSTFSTCGYPYFKDRQGFSAAYSEEFKRRQRQEVFPFLMEEKSKFWLARDKIQLIQGVKKQVIAKIQQKNRDKIRKLSTKRRSNEAHIIDEETQSLDEHHLAELMGMIDENELKIDWFTISMEDLDARHSSNECEGMWNGYLNPMLNRKEWTEAEEEKLINAAIKNNESNWNEIAKSVKYRSAYQCFVHYRTVLAKRNAEKVSRWTAEEDELLLRLIKENSIGSHINWARVLSNMPSRNNQQIYYRYRFTLNPEINRSLFTVEEDCILMAAVKEYGQNFQNFPLNLLPGRNLVQIRNRYNNVLKFVGQRKHWTLEDDQRLMDLVKKHGETNWVKISDELKSHNRTSCRSRYTTITTFLRKNPNSTLDDVKRRKRPFSTNVTADNWMDTIIREKQRDFMTTDSTSDEELSTRRTFSGIISTALGVELYKVFRLSYDFRIGISLAAYDHFYSHLQAMFDLMQTKTTRVDRLEHSSFVDLITASPSDGHVLSISNPRGIQTFRFPVNFNTIIGLRAMIILFQSNEDAEKKKKTPRSLSRNIQVKRKHHSALELFKRRFFSIFKNTAILAKSIPAGPNEKVRIKPTRGTVLPRRYHASDKNSVDFEQCIDETIILCEETVSPSSSRKRQRTVISSETETSADEVNVYEYELTTIGENINIDFNRKGKQLQPSTSRMCETPSKRRKE